MKIRFRDSSFIPLQEERYEVLTAVVNVMLKSLQPLSVMLSLDPWTSFRDWIVFVKSNGIKS